MTHDSDKDSSKSFSKKTHNKKQKNHNISEDQKFVNKANKAFKHRIREIIEDELLEDIDNYHEYR